MRRFTDAMMLALVLQRQFVISTLYMVECKQKKGLFRLLSQQQLSVG
jgi:hypothetical protein